MPPQPTSLSITPAGELSIGWSDGASRSYSVSSLRNVCPCATCREKRSAPPPAGLFTILSAAETRPLTLVQMTPVGNYAYSLQFSDGHDSGIYTFEFLRELGRAAD